jgi:hypothetical protein
MATSELQNHLRFRRGLLEHSDLPEIVFTFSGLISRADMRCEFPLAEVGKFERPFLLKSVREFAQWLCCNPHHW